MPQWFIEGAFTTDAESVNARSGSVIEGAFTIITREVRMTEWFIERAFTAIMREV